jgi:hypothetical protein
MHVRSTMMVLVGYSEVKETTDWTVLFASGIESRISDG